MQIIRLLGEDEMTPVPQLYGVEIEVENVHQVRWIDGTRWRTVPDGSLRNNGMEFVSDPLTRADMLRELATYYRNAALLGYQPHVRTGIHVHADMRWRTLEQVAAICTLYSALEPAMFELCGPQREEGIYCVPWYRSTDDVRLLREARDETRAARVERQMTSTCKYSALYLEPLRRFGTIEFRAAPTYQTFPEMARWLTTIHRLIRAGHALGTPEKVLDKCNTDVTRLLHIVFGGQVPAKAEFLMEQCDSLGVAALLTRIKRRLVWSMDDEDALDTTREYHTKVGRRNRFAELRIEPAHLLRDDDDDYDPDRDNEEEF